MYKLEVTEDFSDWLGSLRDRHAVAIITARLLRIRHGLLGDTRPVGHGIHELRVHVGPGYRVYFVFEGRAVIVLLHGGDKSSQTRDIQAAQLLAARRGLPH